MNKEERREYDRKRYQVNKEKRLEQVRQYYQVNKERILEQKKEYLQEYYQANKERILEQKKEYYQANREQMKEYQKQYRKTQMGRASKLLSGYNQKDKIYNRGKGDLTAQWIVENIFTKPCRYCGKEGWDVIGCDRIYNDKPHSKDNVIPCCEECNTKRGTMDYYEFIKARGVTSPLAKSVQ